MTAPSFPPLSLEPLGMLAALRRRLQISDAGMLAGRRVASWRQLGYYQCRWRMAAIDQLSVVADHTSFTLDASYLDWRVGADRVLEQLHYYLASAPQDFRPYELSASSLEHAVAGVLPLAEIESVRLDFVVGPVVTVMRRAGGEWGTTDLDLVHNVFLFLRALRALNVTVRVNVPVRWPAAVADLAEIIGGPEPLAKATVIVRR